MLFALAAQPWGLAGSSLGPPPRCAGARGPGSAGLPRWGPLAEAPSRLAFAGAKQPHGSVTVGSCQARAPASQFAGAPLSLEIGPPGGACHARPGGLRARACDAAALQGGRSVAVCPGPGDSDARQPARHRRCWSAGRAFAAPRRRPGESPVWARGSMTRSLAGGRPPLGRRAPAPNAHYPCSMVDIVNQKKVAECNSRTGPYCHPCTC